MRPRAAAEGGSLVLRVPWTTLTTAAAVAVFMTMGSVAVPSLTGSPMTLHLAELTLAAGAAYLADDAAAAVTAVVPRALWRRRAFAYSVGVCAVGCAWVVVLVGLTPTRGLSVSAATVETACLVGLSLAASAVLADRGEPEPGNLVAVLVVLVGVSAILVGGGLGFDPYLSGHGTGSHTLLAAWTALGVGSLGVLLLASRDPAGGQRRAYRPEPARLR